MITSSSPSSSLVQVPEMLAEFIDMTKQTEAAKKTALEKEAAALNVLLFELYTRVLFLDPEEGESSNDRNHDRDHNYRRRLTLVDRVRELACGEGNRSMRAGDKLIIYEDGQITRRTSVSQWGNVYFEFVEEKDIMCLDACKWFGFETICNSIIDLMKVQRSLRDGLETEWKERFSQADTLLESVKAEITASSGE